MPEKIEENELIEDEEIETKPEEIEKHHGEYIVRKTYPHEYVIQFSEKENEKVKDLQKIFNTDSVKEVLLELGERLAKGKKYPHLYVINVSTEQKKLIEKVRKQFDVEDVTELLVLLSFIADEEDCPECGYPLELVMLCVNCAECYGLDEEDLNEELEKLRHSEKTEE